MKKQFKRTKSPQYTVRAVPPEVDAALRRQAEQQRRSLNEIVLDALSRHAGISDHGTKYRDLMDLAGRMQKDPKMEAGLQEQRRVEPEMWR